MTLSSARPTSLLIRPSLSLVAAGGALGDLIEAAPLSAGSGATYVSYTLDPATISLAKITSMSVDDPMLNKRSTDWVQGPNTFGSANSGISTLGKSPAVPSPQQDTDQNGKLTDIDMVFPAPKGSASNPYGMVQSVGELGFVHSGIDVSVSAVGLGVPWRTLRLQPETSGSTDLPDWALLDLFSVPMLNTNAFTRPNLQSYGGKINLNARIVPFTNSVGTPLFARLGPLQSLLLNATNTTSPVTNTVTAPLATTLSSNIDSYVLASANGLAGRTFGTGALTNVYFSSGQIAEIAGVADGGEGSEALVRQVLGLSATRGNVFSIYTIGQAVKQDKSGSIHVLSESRFQHIIERWDTGTNVSFRPVYTRTLSP